MTSCRKSGPVSFEFIIMQFLLLSLIFLFCFYIQKGQSRGIAVDRQLRVHMGGRGGFCPLTAEMRHSGLEQNGIAEASVDLLQRDHVQSTGRRFSCPKQVDSVLDER